MQTNIEVEKAQQILLDHVHHTNTESVDLLSSLHRILAENVFAEFNVPNFDKSPLDGFALIAEDTQFASQENPIKLKVIGSVAAGHVFGDSVIKGNTVKIMTGAPMPQGTNCVIRKEDITEKDNYIEVFTALKPYSNYIHAGEDIKKGEQLFKRGDKLTSGKIGLLASLGKSCINVYKKPKVAILSTGSELLALHETLAYGKIYNSNFYTIAASIIEAGGDILPLETVSDNLDLIAEKMAKALTHSDLVLSTGGASVGDYDLIGRAYEKIGAELLFWKISAKPGTPVLAARKNGKLLVGLSGNPAAAYICFENLVRPAILKSSGCQDFFHPKIQGIMAEDFPKGGSGRRFIRANAVYEDGEYKIYLSGKQNPGVLKSVAHCNALIDAFPEKLPLKKGDLVDVILLS
jgi:molybdopterin molybdotransferase